MIRYETNRNYRAIIVNSFVLARLTQSVVYRLALGLL